MPDQNNKEVTFLNNIIAGIVQYPADAYVTRTLDDMGVLLTLSVHPDDMGRVIGREGSTAKSIRTLLRVVGMTVNARVNLKIAEPERSPGAPEKRESF